MDTPFGRVLTAMVTPFDAAGAIDTQGAWDLARHLLAEGSDGVVVAGTTGESPTLSADEKLMLFRTVVEAVGDRGVVIAGTGTYDTAESVHLTRQAVAAGVHGVMAVTPYYSRPPQQGLIEHFTAIADASEVPVIVYNIPSRTGRLIEVPTLARLAAHPRIVAVKDAVGDLAFTTKTAEACGDRLAIYSGDDILTLPMMSVGAVGVVSVASHLAGPQIAAMVRAAAEGAWDEARRLHLRLAPLFSACFLEPNPIPVKAALDALWKPVGRPRLPLVPASADTLAAITAALALAREA
ncbi:MAG: 4-hydroxy-tetrahydrodipicolinate synthase [Acidimicrobiia bacterium]|nr:4-hydroxy-tetrahydrodipicolinate synthase [Acidimicrobiia bacterium]